MVKINVCPKCNSPEIRRAGSVEGWLLPEQWTCDKCGYIGILVQEIDTEDVEKEEKQ
jgi:ribosomal protein L37AE/L43A